jgi:hypothetical protein
MTPADAQIIAESGMPSVRCGHHLAGAVTLDFAGRIAGRAGHTIAFVRDIVTAELNRGCCGLDGAIGCRLVAIQYQISLHGLAYRRFTELSNSSQSAISGARAASDTAERVSIEIFIVRSVA